MVFHNKELTCNYPKINKILPFKANNLYAKITSNQILVPQIV